MLIKGGHVIDPKNGRDGVMDVAIADGKIAEVAPSIDAAKARRIVDAAGLYVVPGLIDLHAHVFLGTEPDAYLSNGLTAVAPDSHSFRSGQTTLVDVGGAGWRNFGQFKTNIIDTSKTRVLSFLNIVGSGMKGGPLEQNLADMDARLTAMRIRQHPGLIVGIKVAHYNGGEWDPVDRAVQAGTEADVPVMIDFGGHIPPLSLDDLLNKHLRPGDILTHMYAHVRGRYPDRQRTGSGRAVRRRRPQARRDLRRRPRRRQLPVAPGRAGHQAGLLPGRDQHRPAHRQPERRHEGHPQHDVEDDEPRACR